MSAGAVLGSVLYMIFFVMSLVESNTSASAAGRGRAWLDPDSSPRTEATTFAVGNLVQGQGIVNPISVTCHAKCKYDGQDAVAAAASPCYIMNRFSGNSEACGAAGAKEVKPVCRPITGRNCDAGRVLLVGPEGRGHRPLPPAQQRPPGTLHEHAPWLPSGSRAAHLAPRLRFRRQHPN